jgi:uncharacterized protein with von Willebrand factor type A (vWA) domain
LEQDRILTVCIEVKSKTTGNITQAARQRIEAAAGEFVEALRKAGISVDPDQALVRARYDWRRWEFEDQLRAARRGPPA